MFLGAINVEIISEGCSDPGIQGCGTASIKVNSIERSNKKRGYNFVVFDLKTGKSSLYKILLVAIPCTFIIMLVVMAQRDPGKSVLLSRALREGNTLFLRTGTFWRENF